MEKWQLKSTKEESFWVKEDLLNAMKQLIWKLKRF